MSRPEDSLLWKSEEKVGVRGAGNGWCHGRYSSRDSSDVFRYPKNRFVFPSLLHNSPRTQSCALGLHRESWKAKPARPAQRGKCLHRQVHHEGMRIRCVRKEPASQIQHGTWATSCQGAKSLYLLLRGAHPCPQFAKTCKPALPACPGAWGRRRMWDGREPANPDRRLRTLPHSSPGRCRKVTKNAPPSRVPTRASPPTSKRKEGKKERHGSELGLDPRFVIFGFPLTQ